MLVELETQYTIKAISPYVSVFAYFFEIIKWSATENFQRTSRILFASDNNHNSNQHYQEVRYRGLVYDVILQRRQVVTLRELDMDKGQSLLGICG